MIVATVPQRDLTQAESNLVAARAAYEKSRVEVDRATGLTLTRLGIDVADAENAQVKKTPNVPGVVPRSQNPQAAPIKPQQPTGPVGQPPAQTAPPSQVPPELQ